MTEGKPLEVLVVGYGSSEVTFIDRLIVGLVQKGVRVTVATPHWKDLERIQASNPGWLWAPNQNSSFLLRAGNLLWLLLKNVGQKRPPWFRKLLDQACNWHSRSEVLYRYLPFIADRWDVIYFPWNSAAIDRIGLFESGTPAVVSCRGSQVNIRPYLQGQEEYVAGLVATMSKAAIVHGVSEDILMEAMNFGLTKEKARIIHPAVDTNVFIPPPTRKTDTIVNLITTGSLIWNKGYEYLLMSLKQLIGSGSDVQMHIIGEGNDRDRILFTVHDLDIVDSVIFHGKLSPAQVLNQLQQADIFVLASLSEGLSNAVLEAMSCGLPVVTSDCGGMREAVSDEVEGFVVPVRDPSAMAEKLKILIDDVTLREQMGKNARERVMREFSLADQIDQFIQLFHEGIRRNKVDGL